MIHSLRNRLTTLTLTSIGCVMLPLLALSYVKVVEEVGELSDARLAQSAKTLEALSAHLGESRRRRADRGAGVDSPERHERGDAAGSRLRNAGRFPVLEHCEPA